MKKKKPFRFKIFDIVEFTDEKGGYGIFIRYIDTEKMFEEIIKDRSKDDKKISDEAMINLYKDLGLVEGLKYAYCEVLVGDPDNKDEWHPIEVETSSLKIATLPTMRFKNFLKKKVEELKNENKTK